MALPLYRLARSSAVHHVLRSTFTPHASSMRSFAAIVSRSSLGPLRVAMPPLSRLLVSSASPPPEEPLDFYAVLGVQKGVDTLTLKEAYKKLAVESHPDRFQGKEREAAEVRFQAISEAFTVLSNETSRALYDEEMERATTAAARAAAMKKVKAQTWNTEVPDLQARLRAKQREDPPMNKHILTACLAFITVNFVLCFNWLAG
ncbi:hypothetical protein AB1Y20_000525 [Prymnesium parvum]|uniref:J domain-containing protein n=1 Tax=Prymnesium parvum TaxID=97485 RepID=A0AB34K889_PRYPA|mmetsp:Transcript_15800/g.37832  ORF Transcript_15800/g.37832 Transcript_15800/m.37832 type:complete len:203 (+) Transcript_15800:56-664(+)